MQQAPESERGLPWWYYNLCVPVCAEVFWRHLQVTGMQAGDLPAAGEETTVEDLLRVVKQLPPDAEAAPVRPCILCPRNFHMHAWTQSAEHTLLPHASSGSVGSKDNRVMR